MHLNALEDWTTHHKHVRSKVVVIDDFNMQLRCQVGHACPRQWLVPVIIVICMLLLLSMLLLTTTMLLLDSRTRRRKIKL